MTICPFGFGYDFSHAKNRSMKPKALCTQTSAFVVTENANGMGSRTVNEHAGANDAGVGFQ